MQIWFRQEDISVWLENKYNLHFLISWSKEHDDGGLNQAHFVWRVRIYAYFFKSNRKEIPIGWINGLSVQRLKNAKFKCRRTSLKRSRIENIHKRPSCVSNDLSSCTWFCLYTKLSAITAWLPDHFTGSSVATATKRSYIIPIVFNPCNSGFKYNSRIT